MTKRLFWPAIWVLLALAPVILSGSQETAKAAGTISVNDAVKAYDEKQFDKAQSILAGLVESGKANEVAYYYLGLLAHDKLAFDKSEQYYRKAIQFNPKYAPPYSDLSVLLLNQKKLMEAEETARKAITLDPSYVNGYLNLGAIQLTAKKKEEAYRSFLSAAKLDPGAVCNLGDQMLLGYENPNAGAAIYYYSIVLKAAPNNPFALLNIGHAYRMLGKMEDAIGFYKRGYEATPKDQKPFDLLYSTYFRALFDTGKYDTILRTAAGKVGTDYPDGQFFRALAFYQLKKSPEFTQAAKRYFELSGKAVPGSLEQWAEGVIHPKKGVR